MAGESSIILISYLEYDIIEFLSKIKINFDCAWAPRIFYEYLEQFSETNEKTHFCSKRYFWNSIFQPFAMSKNNEPYQKLHFYSVDNLCLAIGTVTSIVCSIWPIFVRNVTFCRFQVSFWLQRTFQESSRLSWPVKPLENYILCFIKRL